MQLACLFYNVICLIVKLVFTLTTSPNVSNFELCLFAPYPLLNIIHKHRLKEDVDNLCKEKWMNRGRKA